MLERNRMQFFHELMGFLDEAPGEIQLSKTYQQYPLSRLRELLRGQVIDEIIFAVDSGKLSEMEEVFLLCDEEGVRTRVVVDFFPHVNSQVYLDRLGTSPLLTFSSTPHDEIRLLVKRVTDILLACVWLLLLLPVMLLIAVLVAFPLSWWAMSHWLKGFAYRVPIGVDVFLIAGFSIMFITMLSISFQSVKAARANPIKSLRTE